VKAVFDLDLSVLGQFQYFHFLRPWWWLVLLPMLVVYAYLWFARNPLGRWKQAIAPHLLKAMLVRHGHASWFNPLNMSVLAALLAVTILAGPSWKQQDSPFSEDIAPLVVLLDASTSMLQTDVQPTRLERAKQKVQDLIELRPGGRVALVVYAGTAHSVIPLTKDPDVVMNFLAAVSNEMMPRPGKFPEKALPIAEQMLQDSLVPGTLLMIGDGVSPSTREAFRTYFGVQARQLLILGVGTEQQSESDEASGFTPLERNALAQLADDAGGSYESLTLDKSDVTRLNRRINNHIVIVEDGSRPWADAGYYLLYPFAVLMLLWFRKGWTLHWCLLFMLAGGSGFAPPAYAAGGFLEGWRFADLWMTADQQGRYYMDKGDFQTAAERFEDINWRGIAYYRAEDFIAAAEMFSRMQTVEGYFNLGNALAHGRNYLTALKAYDQALELNPSYAPAIKNRAFIQDIIDQINQMSASQQAEASEASEELGEDDAQMAEGDEREQFDQPQQQAFSAEQVLENEEMNEIWMRQVQKDPARFLRVKFQMQLQDSQ